ncbi:hypothetical protein [Clostridium sp. Marseille-P2415]|uniref:hypothetical protein n=1 Tax=Clostridium sp. Marseille-P2415 TaxID=1805471 RepID=UPI00098878B1|nr:hypothetical protein [Clostridium sp. Marseille-P2415]
MKLRKILCLALVGTMIFSMPVFAAECTEGGNVINIVNEDADSILFKNLTGTENVADCSDFVSVDTLKGKFNMEFNADEAMALASSGDKYEPNNSIATATGGLMGQKITATIHEGDVDWYKLEILDTSEPYSFVLMNIPSGCDYDMALFNSDLTGAYYNFQAGNTAEEFYININQTGTYYLAVQPNTGYSDYPYTLYFGPAFKNGDTGWRDPGLSFNFGYVPLGNDYDTYVPSQYYDLTNDSTIPNGSVMTTLDMTADGNGAYWIGFFKYIKEPSGYGMEQIGNLDRFVVPDMAYYVKQNWEIFGKIRHSNYFVWEPRILIGYKFIVTPQTMVYV